MTIIQSLMFNAVAAFQRAPDVQGTMREQATSQQASVQRERFTIKAAVQSEAATEGAVQRQRLANEAFAARAEQLQAAMLGEGLDAFRIQLTAQLNERVAEISEMFASAIEKQAQQLAETMLEQGMVEGDSSDALASLTQEIAQSLRAQIEPEISAFRDSIEQSAESAFLAVAGKIRSQYAIAPLEKADPTSQPPDAGSVNVYV